MHSLLFQIIIFNYTSLGDFKNECNFDYFCNKEIYFIYRVSYSSYIIHKNKFIMVEIIHAVLGFVLFGLSCYYFYRRPRGSPPGPRGIPFLGAVLSVGKYPERIMRDWSKRYGPIMSVRMGREDWVVLNDYDSIYQALFKQPTKFSGRPENPIFRMISQGLGIILVDYGEFLKSQRRFGFTILREFGVGKESMENRVCEEVAWMNDAIRTKYGKAFDISDITDKATSNNICSVVFGKRFEYDDEKFQQLLNATTNSFNDPVNSFTLQTLIFAPKLRYIPPFSKNLEKILQNERDIMNIVQEIVDEHEKTFDVNDMRDFIDAFLKEMKTGSDNNFTYQQLLQFVRDLFVAGTQTSSSTLYWGLLCFLHYPETQQKLRQEIFKVVGQSGSVSMSHRPNMPYTNAFIQELMRFRTLVPMDVPHKTTEYAELNGYFIPKNTTITPNIWAVHNDPAVFDEPEKFKPDRFIDEKGNFVKSDHVISFSVGFRHCLGEQLARMEIFIYFVSMVQRFEFLPDPDASTLPVIDDGSNGLAYTAHPYKLVAREL